MYNDTLKKKIMHDLSASLSAYRYTHSVGVAGTARSLAMEYGVNPDMAEIAGLLHDAAKELPLPEMQRLAAKAFADTLGPEIMGIGGLLHGYAAVTIARETYGLCEAEFLDSLAHHTTGAPHMGTLEKIIFVADYIEPNREYDGVEALRQAAARDLDEAVLAGYDSTIGHLLEQHKFIFTGTVVNRNAHIAYMKGKDSQ